MEDERYQQLADITDKETNITKSKYAFVGFGRSARLVKDVDLVGEEGQKLQGALANVISLEAAAKSGTKVGKALDAANSYLSELTNKAKQRISQLSQDLATIGQKEEGKRRYNLSANRIGKARKSFKIKTPTARTQKMPKSTQNNRLSRPITGIISAERGKKLSTSRI